MQLFFFSKVNTACHNIANGIKPGSNSKKIDKHALDCRMLGRKVIYVRCIPLKEANIMHKSDV